MKVVIPKIFENTGCQFLSIGNRRYSVSRLIDLSKNLEVFEFPLCCMDISEMAITKDIPMRKFVQHMKQVNDANLNYPIILDEDGCVMDGRHRIAKALVQDLYSIRAVRFDRNPYPDHIELETKKDTE